MKKIISTILIIPLILGCSGSGNDNFFGAARVSVTANPNRIDTGDRTQIKIKINDVNENGIILKVRYPEELQYVTDSSFLEVDSEEDDISPRFNVNSGDGKYLVYFIEQDDFDDDHDGEVTLELEGLEELNDGEIEVDADVDDPTISDLEEFDVENPEFESESSASIEVRED